MGRREFQPGSGSTVSSLALRTHRKDLGSTGPYPDDDSAGTFYVVPKYINPNSDTEVMP